MKHLLLIVLLGIASLSLVAAPYQLYYRLDAGKSMMPEHTAGIVTPYGEVWGFNLDGANYMPRDLQIGFAKPVADLGDNKLSLGAYYATWHFDQPVLPKSTYHYWLAYAKIAREEDDGISYVADMNYYMPTDGGFHILTTTDLHAQYPVAGKVSLGLTGQYTKIVGLSDTLIGGPRISAKLGKGVTASVSYLTWGPDDPKTLRTELSYKF